MEFPPNVWGPFFWHTIHIVALGYPSSPSYIDKKSAKDFYESLQFLIPCPICREHYRSHLQELPITPSIDTKKDLLKWTIDLHNRINKFLNKPEWTEYQVIQYYKNLGKIKCSPVVSSAGLWYVDIKNISIGLMIGSFITAGVFTLNRIFSTGTKSFFLTR